MVVDRDGVAVEGTIVYRSRPAGVVLTRLTVSLIALAFLWLGIWVVFTTRSPHAHRLAMVGVVCALAVPGPYLGVMAGVQDHVQVAAQILWLILLLRFFLHFPTAKRLARSSLIRLLHLPWLVLLGCLVAELVTHPRLYHAFGGFIGILFLGYLAATVLVLAHTAMKTPSAIAVTR